MEHIAAVLLIVGCSPDLADCRELPAPVPIYEAYEDCGADLPATRETIGGLMPKVFATCVDVDPALEDQDAELNWKVTANGLEAWIVTGDTLVARAPDQGTRNQ